MDREPSSRCALRLTGYGLPGRRSGPPQCQYLDNMDAEMENLTREAARVATDGSITDKIRDATLGEVERTIVENS